MEDYKKKIEREMSEIQDDVKRILYILEDDPSTNRKGVVHELHNISTRVGQVEEAIKIWNVKAGLIGGFAGGVVVFIKWIVGIL